MHSELYIYDQVKVRTRYIYMLAIYFSKAVGCDKICK